MPSNWKLRAIVGPMAACLLALPAASPATELWQPAALVDADSAAQEPAADWDGGIAGLDYPEGFADAEATHFDPNVEPTQLGLGAALGVQIGQSQISAQPRRRRQQRRPAVSVGLASIPFMIGDTTAGTCVTFATNGYLSADFAHPTLTCSRLNISENNRTLTTDRLYCSYRHFHNATPIRFFQFADNLDVDRYTLGLEKTLGDGLWSVEFRQPIDYRIKSDTLSIAADIDGNPLNGPELLSLNDGRDAEFANLSIILKRMLVEQRRLAVSCGLGVTVPTAQDVAYTTAASDVFFTDTAGGQPIVVAPGPLASGFFYSSEIEVSNETVYLAPFLSWAYRPTDRFFHQGFLQIEVAANPQKVTFRDNGSVGQIYTDLDANGVPNDPANPDFAVAWLVDGAFANEAEVPLHAQTLMRLNLGFGYFLVDEPRARYLKQLAALFEVHYTTPLQDAVLSRPPLDAILIPGTGTGPPVDVDAFDPVIGNLNSRIDIVNMTLGGSAKVGKTTITNGFTAPITDSNNRGFDFEYNLQVQREY
ncbi:MAG: hypothetical protein AAGJ46_09415 [Planctomycetota bacterium]